MLPTTVTLNSISTLVELRTQIERAFRSFRVVTISTDSGAKHAFGDEAEAAPAILPTLAELAGDGDSVSVSAALRPGTRRRQL